MQQMRDLIDRLAKSQAPVFINGESGSGKELAARAIHMNGPRSEQPFVAVNCGAIPENLMESEFFGYRKGAFTGAESDRDGFFQAANGGTLFLDEVADLPLPMQVKLLRAIQEKKVRKVGATQEEPVDVRIISATHKKLAALVESGNFRQDLYYRLHVIELSMPSLREMREDIPSIANAILAKLTRSGNARAWIDYLLVEVSNSSAGAPCDGGPKRLGQHFEVPLGGSIMLALATLDDIVGASAGWIEVGAGDSGGTTVRIFLPLE